MTQRIDENQYAVLWDMDGVLVVAGGIIPDDDVPALNEMGVNGIFGPGTSTDEIVTFIRENVA